MNEPVAVWSGSFRIWGIELRCYVLDTGERIINGDDFDTFMGALGDGTPCADDADLMAFCRWQQGQT
jgi:hypothetical protein